MNVAQFSVFKWLLRTRIWIQLPKIASSTGPKPVDHRSVSVHQIRLTLGYRRLNLLSFTVASGFVNAVVPCTKILMAISWHGLIMHAASKISVPNSGVCMNIPRFWKDWQPLSYQGQRFAYWTPIAASVNRENTPIFDGQSRSWEMMLKLCPWTKWDQDQARRGQVTFLSIEHSLWQPVIPKPRLSVSAHVNILHIKSTLWGGGAIRKPWMKLKALHNNVPAGQSRHCVAVDQV